MTYWATKLEDERSEDWSSMQRKLQGFISPGRRPHPDFGALGSANCHFCHGELRNAAQCEFFLLLLLLSQPSMSRLAAILDLGRKPIGANTTTRLGSPHINYAESSGRSLQLP